MGDRDIRTVGGHRLDLTNIQYTVQRLIAGGAVLVATKTKAGVGRHTVSVGPYQNATDRSQRYAFLAGKGAHQIEAFAPGPITVARQFVEWVGRDTAREAVIAWARKNPRRGT